MPGGHLTSKTEGQRQRFPDSRIGFALDLWTPKLERLEVSGDKAEAIQTIQLGNRVGYSDVNQQ